MFKINRVFYKSVGIVWSILSVVFAYYMLRFFLGNHDWPYIRFGTAVGMGVWEGRFTQFILHHLFFEGIILPVINVFFSFGLVSLSLVLLAKFWEIQWRVFDVVLFSLLIVLNPYILSQLYYVYLMFPLSCWRLIAVFGACLFYQKKWWLGWLLLCFAISGYAACFVLALVVLLGKMFIECCIKKEDYRVIFKRYIPIFLATLLVGAFYGLAVYMAKKYDVVFGGQYNTQVLSFGDMVRKVFNLWYEPFLLLFSPAMYLSNKMSYMVGMGLILCLSILYKKRRLIAGTIILCLMFYAMALIGFISPYNFLRLDRINVYSVPYVWAFILMIAWQYGCQWQKNLAFLMSVILVLMFIKADFFGQKVWFLGNKQDEMMINRVMTDLRPKLDMNKNYRLSIVGGLKGRKKFVKAPDNILNPEYYDYSYFIEKTSANGLFLYEERNPCYANLFHNIGFFLGNTDEFWIPNYATNDFNPHYQEILEAIDNMQVYPHSSYMYVDEMDIILYLGRNVDKQVVSSVFRY